jgi:hypothetical protein
MRRYGAAWRRVVEVGKMRRVFIVLRSSSTRALSSHADEEEEGRYANVRQVQQLDETDSLGGREGQEQEAWRRRGRAVARGITRTKKRMRTRTRTRTERPCGTPTGASPPCACAVIPWRPAAHATDNEYVKATWVAQAKGLSRATTHNAYVNATFPWPHAPPCTQMERGRLGHRLGQ